MRHGDLPAPTVEQLLEPDPDIYLAGGPLAPDDCECEGTCTCDQ